MKKPAIAIIIPGGIGTGRNNIGVPVMEQLVKLLAREFSITVFSLFKVNDNYIPDGFELISINQRNLVLKIVWFFLAFRKKHRTHTFQAVHGFWVLPGGILAVLTGKLFSIRSIVSVLGGDAIALPEIHYGQLRKPVTRWLIFWALKNADEANALTNYLVNNLRAAGFNCDNIRIIPWGIDQQMFQFREKQLQRPIKFLHIANLHPVKDQETLLKAFGIIASKLESTLTIIGEGVSGSRILMLIDELQLGDRVSILDPLPYEKLPKYYNDADILLHTSLSEGQCEVVTEAMCCGVLVCGTNVGLLYDLPDCCVSVPVRDYHGLAARTIEVVTDKTKMGELRKKAYEWSCQHSIHWTTEGIKDCYRHE